MKDYVTFINNVANLAWANYLYRWIAILSKESRDEYILSTCEDSIF
jgi:hypothetical protein